jgi:hypothetical protein
MRPFHRFNLQPAAWVSIAMAAGGVAFVMRVFLDNRGLLSAIAGASLLLGALLLELARRSARVTR